MSVSRQARATLREVADRAGVSTSTASLVFSGKGPVAAETAERVREAAAVLGYAGPNPLASSLRQGRAGVVGVIVEGRLLHAFRDPFAVSVLDGLAEVLDAIPAGMLLIAQPPTEPERIIPQLSGYALDALVFSLCGPMHNPVVDHLAARGIPMVGNGAPDDPRVVADPARRARRQRLGRPAPARPRPPPRGPHRDAAAARTAPRSPSPPRTSTARHTPTPATGRWASSTCSARTPPWSRPPSPTSSRAAAPGTCSSGRRRRPGPARSWRSRTCWPSGPIQAAGDLGLRVPEDVSVTGFDGIDLPWFAGTLTTVLQHGEEKGQRLGAMVQALLAGEPAPDVVMPTELRIGTTTAPPAP